MAPSSGLRNRLVREYDALEDEIVLEAVSEARAPFSHYVVAIEELLDRDGPRRASLPLHPARPPASRSPNAYSTR